MEDREQAEGELFETAEQKEQELASSFLRADAEIMSRIASRRMYQAAMDRQEGMTRGNPTQSMLKKGIRIDRRADGQDEIKAPDRNISATQGKQTGSIRHQDKDIEKAVIKKDDAANMGNDIHDNIRTDGTDITENPIRDMVHKEADIFHGSEHMKEGITGKTGKEAMAGSHGRITPERINYKQETIKIRGSSAELSHGLTGREAGLRANTDKAVRGTVNRTAKGTSDKAIRKSAGKAVKETAKRTVTETGKKAAKVTVSEAVKEGTGIVAVSSTSTITTAAGTTIGAAGGPAGMAAGIVAGNTIGQAAETGIRQMEAHTARNRLRRKTMQDAMNREKELDMTKQTGKGLLQELYYVAGNSLSALKLTMPGVTAFLGILLTVFFCLGICLLGITFQVMAIAEHMEQNREIIGSLAGGQDVVYYCQHDYRDYPYGDSNISVCGCGPTTMAMVVSTLTGDTVTPGQVADYSMDNNLYVWGIGTSHALFYQYGLNTVDYGTDLFGALSVIPEGGMVILSVGMPDTILADGRHLRNGNSLYRGAGHIMAVRGITEDGKLLLADPNSRDNSEMEWDYTSVSEILKKCWTVTYENPETSVF